MGALFAGHRAIGLALIVFVIGIAALLLTGALRVGWGPNSQPRAPDPGPRRDSAETMHVQDRQDQALAGTRR